MASDPALFRALLGQTKTETGLTAERIVGVQVDCAWLATITEVPFNICLANTFLLLNNSKLVAMLQSRLRTLNSSADICCGLKKRAI